MQFNKIEKPEISSGFSNHHNINHCCLIEQFSYENVLSDIDDLK